MKRLYSEITPEIRRLAELSVARHGITPEMYPLHQVKRGLRDNEGNGVVTGLTEISGIVSKQSDGKGGFLPCEGKLFYRGIPIGDLCRGFLAEGRFGFEETVWLLLFSELPEREELSSFSSLLADYRSLPTSFVRDMILKAPSKNVMNALARSVLALYTYDDDPDSVSVENVLRQSLQLIAMFPLLAVYAYQSYLHYHKKGTLFIRNPERTYGTAENFLYLLREDGRFTPLEARILDLCLVLHAEHGGGNNSSFTTHVVTSSGTDTYSSVAAALGSLKGPRHGGANVKVAEMFDDLKATVDFRDEGAVRAYLEGLLDRERFDRSGLIYGMGHAVYSVSDPRAALLARCAGELAEAKGREEDYRLCQTVARLAPEIIAKKRRIYKGVSPNVDFYSGMVYSMLDIPRELFTPLFSVARIAGWSAHRIEEIENAEKILRPAYVNVRPEGVYLPLDKR